MNVRWTLKIISFILITTGALVSLTADISAQTKTDAINSGTSWLLAARYDMGIWAFDAPPDPLQTEFTADDFKKTYIRDTLEAVKTLQDLNIDSVEYTSTLDWIELVEFLTTDRLGPKIRILSKAGRDTTEAINSILSFHNSDGGFGGAKGYLSDVFDTAEALQSLKAVSYSDQTFINSAISYLLSKQNSDGGFSFYQGDNNNVFITALTSYALQQFPHTTSIATAINKATAYLIAHQNADGGFGSDPSAGSGQASSTVYETAYAYLALVGETTDATVLGNTINYLTSTQLPNGSWNDDPYSTALALRALANVKPNLSISSNDITFSNPTPTAGETITITATIHNEGPGQAPSTGSGQVTVQFYDGDPSAGGVLIEETTIQSIPAFGSSQASITYTIPTASSKTIFIKIDPMNVIDELNETDNIASRNLTGATLPDLSITSADMWIFPPCPDPYIMVGIFIKVRNHGETDASNVLMEIYDGNPSAGGVKLPGGGIIPIIPAGGVADTGAAIAPENVRGPWKDIYVLIDPQNTIPESNETNNTAVKKFSIGACTDLSVSATNITFNPSNPKEGDLVEISAIVYNSGYGRPENVVVRFYLGDPKLGGTQIGSGIVIPSIGYNGHATVTTTWDTTGHVGNNNIYVFADPEDTIEEEYESAAKIWGLDVTNNIAFKTLKVATSQGPDLTLTSSDITFIPQSPLKGDLVTITANIRNIGNQDASNVPVEFSIYDPVIGASLIIGSQTIPLIPKGSSSAAQITWDTNIFSGSYDIHVNVDPSNIIFELNETNNEAQKPITITPPQGPDIVIFSIDKAGVISDPQTRTISGNVNVTIKNIGNQNTVLPFVITAFEDRNNNRAFDPGTDSILGQITYSGNLSAEMTATVNIPISGTVLFIDSPLYLMADSGNAVVETDETNNIECLSVFTTCRNSKVDEAIKEGASWLIDHQLNVDAQGTMKAWAGGSIFYNAFALKAYKSTGRTSQTKYENVLNKLIQMQAPDGSWDESVYTAAQTIVSLLYIGIDPNSTAINDAVSWLMRQQNTDGGWGGQRGYQSTAYYTGLAITALIKAGVNKNEPFIQKAAQWLKDTQNSDGYWGEYPGAQSVDHIDTFPVIGLALATSPADSKVQAAKKWYYTRRLYREYAMLYWLRMMLEIEPTNSEIMYVATSLQNLQMPDGGWRWYSIYIYSSFRMTADVLDTLGRLGFTGTRINNGITWIENHINSLWEGFPEEKNIQTTDSVLNALQAANIGDSANLGAITTGRKAILSGQNYDGSWPYYIPVGPSQYEPLIGPTGESLFALKYYQNVLPTEQSAAYKASNFLTITQLGDGGWSYHKGISTSDLYCSEVALMSLLQFGLTANNTTVAKGLSYLNTKQNLDGGFGNTEQTARATIIHKLAGAPYQSKLEQTIAWLKANQNPDGGWGTMLGYTSTTGSTSWALIALSFAGETGIEVARGVSWLLAAQNQDNGWGSIMGVPMSYDSTTAMAVWALSLAKFSLAFNLDVAVERYDYCPNDIVRLTVTPDKPAQDIFLNGSLSLQEGASYPLTLNLVNNTFSSEFTVPSNALPGTATVQVTGTATYGYGVGTISFIIKNCSSLKPDLSISESDIRAVSEEPQNIDSRRIYATIRNQGGIDANNVKVDFYRSSVSPENLINSQIVSNIPVSGSFTVSTSTVLSQDTVIYVIVDPDNAIDETDKSNNIASVVLIRTIPDLSISQTDITIIPPDTIEGQPAVITAIIHNTGNLVTSDVVISFYDGDPQSGGTLIGSLIKSQIDAGATALAEMTWNTYGQSGRNYVHVAVDPQNLIQESNENNNSTLIRVDVAPPTKPDLAITSSDITFSSLNPKEGDPLTLNAFIHNFGTDASDIEVNLYDGDPSQGGILLSQKTIQQIIPFGGTYTLSFSLDTIGLTGNRSFYITIDPNNLIDETNETNNTAWNTLTIGSSELSISVSTNKTTYTSNEDLLITINISNLLNTERSGELTIKVTDLSDNVVSAVASNQALTLSPNENKALTFTWNTGQTLSGSYKVYSHFIENGNIIAKADTPVTINPLIAIFSNITTEKISYFPNETVTLTSTIQSTSTNYIFENLSAKITITNNQGAVLYTETNAIPILMPIQLTEFKTYWNTSTNPSGDYPVILEIKDSSGNVLSTSTKTLTITNAIKPSKLLKGQISVDKQSLLQGEPVAITYSVTNIGNIDLSQIDLSILTVHVVELTAYDTLTDQTSLQMGATYTNTQTLNTNNYSAKDYLVILRANISGIEETLAGTYFRVEGAPSVPSLNSPRHGEDIETLTPLLTVNNASDPNDDKLTYEFELYTDSNLSNLLTSSGMISEGENITAWQVPLELQENGVYYWRARAYDGRLYGEWMLPATFRVNLTNEPPTAPTPSSPADNSEVDTLTPILTVNNASDPDSTNLTYNFELSLNADFIQIAASQIGIFEGVGTTSWHPSTGSGQEPLILQENTYYYWRAQADDWLIEGPWMTTTRFFVNTANDAPTTPSILYPLNNTEITTLNTDVIVSNSEDPDSTTLTYIFEIDTVMTFDSSNIIRSGNIPTTSWHIEGLNDNTYYFIRAKASDGLAESQWSEVVSFFVNTQNDAPTTPVLANPSDGSGVNTFTPALSIHNSSDIDRDVLTYEFEVYGDAAMTNLVASVTGIQETPQITSWTGPVNLTENNTYYWRARAYDGELYSGWMPLASFMVNTANDAPSAPSLHLPANGSSLDTLYPTLSVYNAIDPDSDTLTYDFEIYSNGILIQSITGIPQGNSGITSVIVPNALTDNTTYNWRARAYDGDRYGAWMDMATFSIHLPVTNITATIDFDPNTLNKKSNGNWVTVYIELPAGYNVNNIIISSIRLQGTIHAESWPYCIGDYDNDGIPDLMVKFKRADVINLLPNGDNVQILVTGTVGTTTFEGVDTIRVIK